MGAGILASAVLSGLYARGGAGWLLGFVALVPWLRTLDASRTLAGTLLGAWAMSVAFTAAVFAWFGSAIGSYTQLGAATGLAVLLLAAPLFQPQFLAFALVRHVAGRRHGPLLRALAGAAAWVATEWLVPRLLGDTLGYGLYPSRLLRQAADVGGAAGLTRPAAAGERRHRGGARAPRTTASARWRSRWRWPRWCRSLLAGYGLAALSATSGAGRQAAARWRWCSRTSSTTSACAARRAPARSFARCSTRTTR